ISFLNEMSSSCRMTVFCTDVTAEFYFFGILRTAKFKGIAVFEPVIRYFHLESVPDFLFEHTVTITDTASVRTVSQRSQRIQETGCQSSQTSVSKGGIRFLIFDHIQIESQFIQRFLYLLISCKVNQVIS